MVDDLLPLIHGKKKLTLREAYSYLMSYEEKAMILVYDSQVMQHLKNMVVA